MFENTRCQKHRNTLGHTKAPAPNSLNIKMHTLTIKLLVGQHDYFLSSDKLYGRTQCTPLCNLSSVEDIYKPDIEKECTISVGIKGQNTNNLPYSPDVKGIQLSYTLEQVTIFR